MATSFPIDKEGAAKRREEAEMDALILAERLKSVRLGRKWTITAMARRMDVYPQRITHIERGIKVDTELFFEYARALGVNLLPAMQKAADESIEH